jgi:hypothetical protein
MTHTQHTPGKGPALQFPDGLINRLMAVLVEIGTLMGGFGL